MPRPTTWRRSWNRSLGAHGIASYMDLLVIQPGETLGGVWWTYRANSGPFGSTEYLPGSSVTIVGLVLTQEGDPLPDPLEDPGADWLWWEPVNWRVVTSASTEIYWLYTAWGPRSERKAETMRKAAPGANSVLRVVMRTDLANGSQGFVNQMELQAAASALVILPA